MMHDPAERPHRETTRAVDALADLFGADSVLPEQIVAGHRHDSYLSGESALMLAVLEDAIRCFQEHLRNPRNNPQQLCAEAEEWIRADDWDWPVSFNNVCDRLGIDPSALRHTLLHWKAKQIAARSDKHSNVPQRVYRLHLRTKRARAVR